MSVDRTKILEAAQKHLAKGAYDKAIAELQKLVKADPSDVRTWLKIGDLFAKKGSTKDAVDTYAKVAEQYSSQGFFLKAVAVYKQILKLDPTRLDIQLQLAESYENLQLSSDALATYEQVAASYARSGNIDKALSTLAKMCELEPENIPIRIKYAEALSKANRAKEAADSFEIGVRLLEAQGRIEDSIKVAERLLFHRPDDVAIARKLSKLYLERNDAKRALAKLQICFKADPKDVPTLEMLGEAFHQLGQLPKTISVYREVARIHQEANRGEERARILKRILELDPGDAEARQALAAYAQPAAPATAASVSRRDIAPPPGAVVAPPPRSEPATADAEEAEEAEEDAEDLEEIEELEYAEDYADEDAQDEAALEARGVDESAPDEAAYAQSGDAYAADDDDEEVIIVAEEEDAAPESVQPADGGTHGGSQAPGASGSVLPPEIAREAQIAKLLTETEVFLRYGLKQKVLDQLRKVIGLDPTHVQARERLKDLLLERGDLEGAIGELVMLADLFVAQRPSVAMLYLRQITELDPENGEALARMALIEPAPHRASSAPAQAEPPRRDAFDEDEPTTFGMAPEDGVFFVQDDEHGAAMSASAVAPSAVAPSAVAVPPPGAMHYDEPAEDEASLSGGEIYEPALDDDALAQAEDPLAPMSPDEFERAPLRPSTPGFVVDEGARDSVPRMSMPPGEVEELLDEAEFFVAQGLYEEARAMLRDSLSAHPRNRLIADKLGEVEELATQAAEAQSAARAAAPASAYSGRSDDQSFELAERLAEDLGDAREEEADAGSDVLDIEHVFAQFKKGVEQQVGLEDTETHFDLGIAYKEMGLLQDAIAEFTLCLSNPQKACIAHTMVGLCQIEKGEVSDAIGHFKKGLYADNKTDREELGLYYELGRAYELLHDPKEALYYFEKVRKRDAGFRQVNERIQALTRPSPQQAAPAANDDIDAAFDDLMGGEKS